jgi:hypothetical protein
MPNWNSRANGLADGMPQHRRRRHDAVGVKHECEIVVLAPPVAEVADVAGLECGVGLAPPIGDAQPFTPGLRHRGEQALLGLRDRGIVGIAKDVDVKVRRGVARGQPLHQRHQKGRRPLWQLVADADQDGGRGSDRFSASDAGGGWRDSRHYVAREPYDQESDRGVPEADHHPGQRNREQDDQDEIDKAEAAGRQRHHQEPDHAHHCEADQGQEHDAAQRQRDRRGRKRGLLKGLVGHGGLVLFVRPGYPAGRLRLSRVHPL